MAGTIKVRIALAVNPAGQWNAYGYSDGTTWSEIMDTFEMLDDEHRYFIEAEVPLPDATPKAIQAEVIPVDA